MRARPRLGMLLSLLPAAAIGCTPGGDDTRGDTSEGATTLTTAASAPSTATAGSSTGDATEDASAGETSAATTASATTTTSSAMTTTTATSGDATGSSGASVGATSEGDTSTGGGSRCVHEVLGGPFEVTPQSTAHEFALPMQPDTPYSRLEVELVFTLTDWGGNCYNPYYDPPKLVPVFHKLLTLQRGTHWCKGGDLGALELRGPNKNSLNGEVYFKETPWGGSGCGPEVTPHAIFGNQPGLQLAAGQTHALRFVYDAALSEITAEFNGQLFTGTPHPDAQLLAQAGSPLHLVLSFENSFECYDAQGDPDDNAVCCHAPSWGWIYDQVEYTLCD